MRFFGAQTDMARCVKKHLFILCPNNSGSTFLAKSLSACAAVWSLPREGQHVFGFDGPCSNALSGNALIWAANADLRAEFEDEAAYNWAAIRRAWYFQASAARPDASVFLQKSPPHLLIAEALSAAFPHSYFILMVRNPFATVEGILRRKMWDLDRAEKTRLAAQHVLNCFRKQLENRKALGSRGLWLTYEALCKNPRSTAEDISLFLPELGDLTFEKKVPVKGLYDEPARDFNADQIARLSEADIRIISNVLSQDMPTLRDVGYSPAQP